MKSLINEHQAMNRIESEQTDPSDQKQTQIPKSSSKQTHERKSQQIIEKNLKKKPEIESG